MFRRTLVTALIVFFFCLSVLNYAIAGEKVKIKAQGASFMVKFEQINVGDDEGHIIGIYEQKVVYHDQSTGEASAERLVGFVDINPKTGSGSLQGYGVMTDKDGDKSCSTSKGQLVGKGQWRGEWTLVKGTGKHEGAKGGGTFFARSLDQQLGVVEVEGEVEMASP